MHTVDDGQSPISGEHDDNSSTVQRKIKLKEVINPRERRSSGGSRIMVRFKLSSAAEDEKVSAGDEEKIPATKEKLNNIILEEDRPSVMVFPSPTKPEAIITPVISKSEQETACNTPPQEAISNPECNKKSARLRRNCENSGRAKFFVSLSRHEIEQDFIAITGKRPSGKPKKRPRVVQNQINAIFPCQCLTEVHADHYKVKDN